MMVKRAAIILLFLLCCFPARQVFAQRSDTLDAVQVRSRRQKTADAKPAFSSGQQTRSIDSATRSQYEQQSIATLVAQQLPVFVKSYSFNGLSTLHFRGSSAAQSQVLWNGVPIQNAALGVADVSSLPVLLFRNVSVVYGGSGALYGSGNVGGALLLNDNPPVFDSNHHAFSASLAGGSFGQLSGGLASSVGGKKWYASATIFSQRANNDYLYVDNAGKERKMPNARLQSAAALLRGAYRVDSFNTVSVSAWVQQYDREIPPALFEPFSVKSQQDRSLRFLADWQLQKPQYAAFARASFIADHIHYADSAVGIATSNGVNQYFHELGMHWEVREKLNLLVFSPVQWSWLPSGNDTQYQRRIALAAAATYKLMPHGSVSLQGRAENINGRSIFLPGAGAAYMPARWLSLRMNAQKTYRLPSLNELYYFPGGNPQLKPEQGWNFDGGYTVYANYGRLSLRHEGSLFTRRIHDWIVWLGGAVWTPHNIAMVHSRGTETETKLSYRLRSCTLHLSAATTYVLATTKDSYVPGDGSLGKQIPYTPRYNGRSNIGFTWRQIYFNYNHCYTGYRFTTTDESIWLAPYTTGNIQLSYVIGKDRGTFSLNAQCNNVWDANYSVAAFRPMPGRNWLLGAKISF